jgi:hypothetical protein
MEVAEEFIAVERRPAPTSPEELRALLDEDKPFVLLGMAKGLPAANWTVEHLVKSANQVKVHNKNKFLLVSLRYSEVGLD